MAVLLTWVVFTLICFTWVAICTAAWRGVVWVYRKGVERWAQ